MLRSSSDISFACFFVVLFYLYIGRGSGEFVVRKVEGNLECLRGSLSFGLSFSYNSGFLSCSCVQTFIARLCR